MPIADLLDKDGDTQLLDLESVRKSIKKIVRNQNGNVRYPWMIRNPDDVNFMNSCRNDPFRFLLESDW